VSRLVVTIETHQNGVFLFNNLNIQYIQKKFTNKKLKILHIQDVDILDYVYIVCIGVKFSKVKTVFHSKTII
jgi:hypothetical protein